MGKLADKIGDDRVGGGGGGGLWVHALTDEATLCRPSGFCGYPPKACPFDFAQGRRGQACGKSS